jgi:hypothetical protein
MRNLIRQILREEIELKDFPKGKWSLDLLNYYRSRLPNMPDYVIMDMFSEKHGKYEEKWLQTNVDLYKDHKWKLVKDFPISLDIFDEHSKDMLIKRIGNKIINFVPKDKERHEFQQQQIKTKGIPTEPIILVKEGDKYALWEGWHRTIQLLKQFPEGYKYPQVYIGYK